MLNSTQMKAELIAYWRYKRQCPVVGVECFEQDVLAVTKARQVIWTEVKVSLSDLRADGRKEFHFRAAQMLGIKKEAKNYAEARAQIRAEWIHREGLPNQFYFAVPHELAEKALEVIEQRYPYAGLIVVRHYPERMYWGDSVMVTKLAPTLHKDKCSIKYVSHIVKSMTASLASAYKAMVKATPVVKETPEVKVETAVS